MIHGSGEGIRVRLKGQFGRFTLDVALELPGRGVSVLFGGSGSGKTTLLRCIAGLERVARGALSVNGEVWQDDASQIFMPAHRRAVGYVFQDAALFPHLTVRRNLEFGLKRIPKTERRVPIEQAVELLNIGPLLARYPTRLSGGEQQRVAMARALLSSPKLLLMDEPLASLDIPLKREILPYLERLHDELNIPMLYVTHSPDELVKLGDYLVMLDGGSVTEYGPLMSMLTRLEDMSGFTEEPGAVLEARVVSHDATIGLTRLEFSGGHLLTPLGATRTGQRLRCRVLPADVSLTLTRATDTSVLNVLPARVMSLEVRYDLMQALVQLDVGGAVLFARITRYSCERLKLRPGLPVYAQIKAVTLLE